MSSEQGDIKTLLMMISSSDVHNVIKNEMGASGFQIAVLADLEKGLEYLKLPPRSNKSEN